MESRAKVLGHPLHPMLIVFPLGLFATSIIFDLLYLYSRESLWAALSYYLIAAGLIGGVIAAIPGVIDWYAIPANTRAKAIGSLHGLGNIVVLGVFLISFLLRTTPQFVPTVGAHVFSFIGVILSIVTGWLGGELVDRLGVGIDDDASLNATSSLLRGRRP